MAVSVQGVDVLVKRMQTLPDKLRNKGMRGAMKKCARPIVQAVKARVPVRTGLLRQAIASVVVKSKDSYSAMIGARHIFNKKTKKRRFKPTKTVASRANALGVENADPARYFHLVEKGHATVSGGRVRAYPALGPGTIAGADAAEKVLAAELRQFLESEAGK